MNEVKNTRKRLSKNDEQFNKSFIKFLSSEEPQRSIIFRDDLQQKIKGKVVMVLQKIGYTNVSSYDDIIQDCHIKILTKLTEDKVDGISNILGYVSSIIHNNIKNYLRGKDNYSKYHNRLALFAKTNNKPWGNGYETPQETDESLNSQFTTVNNERI
jgi:DNA-directed RNA polymerase specialized sigma24 family protein